MSSPEAAARSGAAMAPAPAVALPKAWLGSSLALGERNYPDGAPDSPAFLTLDEEVRRSITSPFPVV